MRGAVTELLVTLCLKFPTLLSSLEVFETVKEAATAGLVDLQGLPVSSRGWVCFTA